MTILAIIFGLLLFQFVSKSGADTTSKRMLSMFIIYWFVSIVLASIQVYDIFKIHPYTFILIIVGLFSFVFGFLIVGNRRNSRYVITNEDVSRQFLALSNSIIYRIIIIVAAAYVYSLLVTFFGKILLYGSLANVRTDYYSADLYGPLFGQLNAFFLRPVYLVSVPVFSYLLLYKRNWVCLVLGFFLFGYESLGGGRIGYIRLILGVVFIAYCLLQTFKNNKKKGYTIVLVGGIVVFGLLTVVSAARMGEIGSDTETRKMGAETTLKHIVTYTAGPIAAFDYSIEHGYSDLIGGYQYGSLTLTPAISFINLFSSRVGFTISNRLDDLVEYKQEIPIDISPSMDWNALYTANLYFYDDLGLIGMFLFPLLFGMLISYLLSQLFKYKSLPLIMIMSYCMWNMMYSVLDYGFTSPYDMLVLVVMYYLGTRKKYLHKPSFR